MSSPRDTLITKPVGVVGRISPLTLDHGRGLKLTTMTKGEHAPQNTMPTGRPRLRTAQAVKFLTMLAPGIWHDQRSLISEMGVTRKTFHKVVAEARWLIRPVDHDVKIRRSFESDEDGGERGWVACYSVTATFDKITASLSEAEL